MISAPTLPWHGPITRLPPHAIEDQRPANDLATGTSRPSTGALDGTRDHPSKAYIYRGPKHAPAATAPNNSS